MGLTSQLYRNVKPTPEQQNKGKFSKGTPETAFEAGKKTLQCLWLRRESGTCGVNLCCELLS